MNARRRAFGAVGAVGLAVVSLAGCGFGETTTATAVTDIGATLTGKVHNTVTGSTEYWFEYGPTSAYGSSTTPTTINVPYTEQGDDVGASVGGLAEGATYHYRLCALDQDRHGICGADQAFTTSSGRDSVTGFGKVLDLGAVGYVYAGSVTATSGPSGAGPISGSGGLSPGSYYFKVGDGGAVTCLRVEGNRATVGFTAQDPFGTGAGPVYRLMFIEDNGPTGDRLDDATLAAPATTCPAPTAADFDGFDLGGQHIPSLVTSGDFVVHDHAAPDVPPDRWTNRASEIRRGQAKSSSRSSPSRSTLIAFSTARRARVSRRSSTGSSWPPASTDSRRRSMARSASSSLIVSSRRRMSSNSPAMRNFLVQPGGYARHLARAPSGPIPRCEP